MEDVGYGGLLEKGIGGTISIRASFDKPTTPTISIRASSNGLGMCAVAFSNEPAASIIWVHSNGLAISIISTWSYSGRMAAPIAFVRVSSNELVALTTSIRASSSKPISSTS